MAEKRPEVDGLDAWADYVVGRFVDEDGQEFWEIRRTNSYGGDTVWRRRPPDTWNRCHPITILHSYITSLYWPEEDHHPGAWIGVS